MEKIGKISKKVFRDKKLDRAAGAAFVCFEAQKILKDIFDKEFLKEIEVFCQKEDFLYIKTSSSMYSQELKIKELEILKTLNGKTPTKIKGIKFRSKT